MNLIINRPFPKLTLELFKKNKLEKFYKKLLYFKNGREALLYGLNQIGITKEMKILCPAYICNSLTNTLIENGYNLVFYDIELDLKIDLNNIETIIKKDKISGFIFVYYFGFKLDIAPIKAICKRFDIKLIEDCSHSFLSNYGINKKEFMKNISIYSMRKILPVLDGGALLLHKLPSEVRNQEVSIKLSIKYDLLYYFERIFEFLITKIPLINIYSKRFLFLKNKLNGILKINNGLNTGKILSQPLKYHSIFLNFFLRNSYLKNISIKRIENYNYLSLEIRKLGFKPLFDTLKEAEIPQFFVFIDSTGNLVDWLRQNGFGALNWPGDEIPSQILSNQSDYQNSLTLNKKLVCIPIHEDLNSKVYYILLKKLRRWKNLFT